MSLHEIIDQNQNPKSPGLAPNTDFEELSTLRGSWRHEKRPAIIITCEDTLVESSGEMIDRLLRGVPMVRLQAVRACYLPLSEIVVSSPEFFDMINVWDIREVIRAGAMLEVY